MVGSDLLLLGVIVVDVFDAYDDVFMELLRRDVLA